MSELVERLRKICSYCVCGDCEAVEQAAAEIERLSGEVERLRKDAIKTAAIASTEAAEARADAAEARVREAVEVLAALVALRGDRDIERGSLWSKARATLAKIGEPS